MQTADYFPSRDVAARGSRGPAGPSVRGSSVTHWPLHSVSRARVSGGRSCVVSECHVVRCCSVAAAAHVAAGAVGGEEGVLLPAAARHRAPASERRWIRRHELSSRFSFRKRNTLSSAVGERLVRSRAPTTHYYEDGIKRTHRVTRPTLPPTSGAT
ncbi:unnamed protein product [Danaus chrysippus]|uniref:(African queen) hypothetical protein n=1 Tax=Danaus chrysippus TaxID=151541 RepID=A0A8J2R2M1_9NEOP|nr:unnamed protein product [Danaus chrysippus]